MKRSFFGMKGKKVRKDPRPLTRDLKASCKLTRAYFHGCEFRRARDIVGEVWENQHELTVGQKPSTCTSTRSKISDERLLGDGSTSQRHP